MQQQLAVMGAGREEERKRTAVLQTQLEAAEKRASAGEECRKTLLSKQDALNKSLNEVAIPSCCLVRGGSVWPHWLRIRR